MYLFAVEKLLPNHSCAYLVSIKGSVTTGYGVIEAEREKFSALTFGVVRTDAQCAFAFRLKKFMTSFAH